MDRRSSFSETPVDQAAASEDEPAKLCSTAQNSASALRPTDVQSHAVCAQVDARQVKPMGIDDCFGHPDAIRLDNAKAQDFQHGVSECLGMMGPTPQVGSAQQAQNRGAVLFPKKIARQERPESPSSLPGVSFQTGIQCGKPAQSTRIRGGDDQVIPTSPDRIRPGLHPMKAMRLDKAGLHAAAWNIRQSTTSIPIGTVHQDLSSSTSPADSQCSSGDTWLPAQSCT